MQEAQILTNISKCRQIDRQQNNCSSFVAKARLLGLIQFRIIT